MPTYEYKCQTCGHRFEVVQKMKDPFLTECPECKGPVKRLIGAGAGMIFKGNGFYCTDYRSSDYQKKAKNETAKTDTSSEPKKTPEKKSEPAPKKEE